MTTFTRVGQWYKADSITVDGVTNSGWVKPTSIRLEKNSALAKRRLVISYLFKFSTSDTPPQEADCRMVSSEGDTEFVTTVPEAIESIQRVQQLVESQMKLVLSQSGLKPVTVTTMTVLDYGKNPNRDTYPIEHDGSPTGYMAVWGVRHIEQYGLTASGGLEVLYSASDFRCGWWAAAYAPQDTYTYPETLYFSLQHRYASWPLMIAEIQKAAIANGYVTQVEQYRREFA